MCDVKGCDEEAEDTKYRLGKDYPLDLCVEHGADLIKLVKKLLDPNQKKLSDVESFRR
jgi:hypothetical protein